MHKHTPTPNTSTYTRKYYCSIKQHLNDSIEAKNIQSLQSQVVLVHGSYELQPQAFYFHAH